jgi:hypothetical protein
MLREHRNRLVSVIRTLMLLFGILGLTPMVSLAQIGPYSAGTAPIASYGLTCGGPGAVPDNTAAMQAWLNQAGPNVVLVAPPGVCNFSSTLTIPVTSRYSIIGTGPFTTVFNYIGQNTTNDLIVSGSTAAESDNVFLANFRISSSTTMTGGTALHVIFFGRSFLTGVILDGQDGNGNLYNGLWDDQGDDLRYTGFLASASNDVIRVSGTGAIGDTLILDNGRIVPAKGGHTGAVGIHIGGGFGNLRCGNVDVIGQNNNVLIDNAIVSVGNRQTFLLDGCTVDSGKTDNIVVNDPLSSNSSLDINGWVASAARYNLSVVSMPGGFISIKSAQFWNSTSDCIFVQTASPRLTISPDAQIHACSGYGINASVTATNVFSFANMFGNVSGNFGPNVTNGGLQLIPFTSTTVASLPTCNAASKYQISAVSDASSPTYGATLTGGGTTPVLAVCNGSNWTAH